MAKRKQWMGTTLIEADNGVGFERNPTTGAYITEVFGVHYALKKSKGRGATVGWYLSAQGDAPFEGHFCARELMLAVDRAAEVIIRTDLRAEGYERKTRKETVPMSARSVLHVSHCPAIGACKYVGGAGTRRACDELDRALDKVADDRAHEEAAKLRLRADELWAKSQNLAAEVMVDAYRLAANDMDPYHLVDGKLVRKSDGRPVTWRGAGS